MTEDNKPSALAEMVMLAPKVRELLATIELPGDDASWQDIQRSFRLVIAWVEYWKACSNCPDVTLIGASMLEQLTSAAAEADRVSSPKLVQKFSDKTDQLEQLRLAGDVYSKGWLVIRELLLQP